MLGFFVMKKGKQKYLNSSSHGHSYESDPCWVKSSKKKLYRHLNINIRKSLKEKILALFSLWLLLWRLRFLFLGKSNDEPLVN